MNKLSSFAPGKFCIQNHLSIADMCLIPQVYNANRFGVDISAYPNIQRINETVLELEWTKAATPEAQKDATPQ